MNIACLGPRGWRGAAEPGCGYAVQCSHGAVRQCRNRRRRRYIADLMVEDRKKKYGMHVCSSEKAMPPATWSEYHSTCCRYGEHSPSSTSFSRSMGRVLVVAAHVGMALRWWVGSTATD
jgi:hypothetical protein